MEGKMVGHFVRRWGATAVLAGYVVVAVAGCGGGSGNGSLLPPPHGSGGGGSGATSGTGGQSSSSTVTTDITAMGPPDIGDIGVLPAPLTVASGSDPDTLANYLVGVARSWTSDALPAFEAALLQAGYTIRNGSDILFQPATSNGIAIEAWDVQAAKGLLDRGLSSSLADLAAAFDGAIDGIQLDIASNVIASVSAAQASGIPTLVFWGDLVTELGRRADNPHDFATLTPDDDVQLSPPETLLLFTRMAADLYAWSAAGDSGTAMFAHAGQLVQTAADASPSPCQLDDKTQLILDYNATGMGKAFDALTEFAGEHFSGVAQYAKFTSLANLAGAYIKLLWTFLAFDADIQFTTDPQSLTRTKTSAAGERKTLQVTATFSTKNAQILNCVRPALNTLGLDFSLPSDGPIQGAGVKWNILAGGTTGGTDPTFGFVEFVGSDPLHGSTDKNGMATIDIEGTPQRSQVKDDAKPVTRRAKVYAGFVIKPANIYQDLIDAVGGGVMPSFTGLLTTPAEMLYRTSEVFGRSWAFPVIDWSMGTLHWEEKGTLNAQSSWSDTQTTRSGTQSEVVTYSDSRTYDVIAAHVSSVLGHLSGTIQLQPSDLSFSEHVQYRREDDLGGDCPSAQVTTFQLPLDGQGSTTSGFPVVLGVESDGGSRYSIDVDLPGYTISGTSTKTVTSTSASQCSSSDDTSSTTQANVSETTRSDTETLTGAYEGTFQGHKEFDSTVEPILNVELGEAPPKAQTTIVLDWDLAVPVN
jgi:hypothetical protein